MLAHNFQQKQVVDYDEFINNRLMLQCWQHAKYNRTFKKCTIWRLRQDFLFTRHLQDAVCCKHIETIFTEHHNVLA